MSSLVTYSLLFLLLVLTCWFAYHLKRDPRANPLDLITSPVTGRLSAAKIGQLVGLVVSTWVVISFTASEKLGVDLFLAYLAYVAGVDLFGKYLRSKDPKPSEVSDGSKEGE